MSKPSFSNIDLWLYELAEGNLSPDQVQRLELFLLQNPDLDIDRDMWEAARIENTPVVYPDVAVLERKRRPTAIILGSLLLLLLIGAGTFGVWTISDGIEEEKTPKATIDEKQTKLEKEVDYLITELARMSNTSVQIEESMYSIQQNRLLEKSSIAFMNPLFGGGALNDRWSIESNTDNDGSWFTSSLATTNSAVQNDELAIGSEYAAQNEVSNLQASIEAVAMNNGQLSHGKANESSTLEELNVRNFGREHVGREDFHTRAVAQIDYTGRHRWEERSRPINYGASSGGGSAKLSFGKKMKRMTRMVRRMADNPVALRNSRDPHYHVPGLTSNDVSFSSAGTLISTRVQAMSRIQWLGQENEQLINELAIDGYSYGIRGGWGVQLNHSMYDDGGIHIGQAAFTYSPKFSVNSSFSIEPSVRFKMGNKHLNSEMLDGIDRVELDRGTAHDFYPGEQNQIGRNLWYKDLGVGLLVNTKWFFAGIQADNLFKHNDNIYSNDFGLKHRVGNHIIATVGTDWLSRTEKLGLSPYVVYQKKDKLSEAWVGMNFKWNWLNLGIATSQKLDPSASIGMKFDQFSLHYNADYTTSKMTSTRALSHQVTMRIQAKPSRSGQRLIKL